VVRSNRTGRDVLNAGNFQQQRGPQKVVSTRGVRVCAPVLSGLVWVITTSAAAHVYVGVREGVSLPRQAGGGGWEVKSVCAAGEGMKGAVTVW